MRIAVVGNFALTGNQTMAVRALPLAEALAARGHSVRMVLPRRHAGEPKVPHNPRGVDLHLVGRCLGIPLLAQVYQLLSLAHYTWHWHPDLLYCFKPIAYSGAVLGFFRWMRRFGLFHGSIVLDSDDWEGDGGWNERQSFPGWVKRLITMQERWTLTHADLVTVASRALVRRVKQLGVDRLLYLPNAPAPSSPGLQTPADPQLRARLGLEGRPLLLLYTRFFEYGLDRLLDSLEAIVQEMPETVLLVVGQGLSGEEQELARLAEQRGLAQRIVQAGWLPREEVASYFKAADVAIYPLDDNFLNQTKCPVKLLDLVAGGVPVVADRVGQAEEYLQDGRTGVLVAPGDVQTMAHAAVELLRDPVRRMAMGEAARAEARERWRWDRWAEDLESALAEPRPLPRASLSGGESL